MASLQSFAVLGAGVAGLQAAAQLKQAGETLHSEIRGQAEPGVASSASSAASAGASAAGDSFVTVSLM